MTAQAEVSSVHDDEAHDRDEGMSITRSCTAWMVPSKMVEPPWEEILEADEMTDTAVYADRVAGIMEKDGV